MKDYVEAKGICLSALKEFRDDIEVMLPDDKGEYLFAWDLTDCKTVKNLIDCAVVKILSTCMVHHVALELRGVQEDYSSAFKSKDIRRCQRVLTRAVEAFNGVFWACQAIKEY